MLEEVCPPSTGYFMRKNLVVVKNTYYLFLIFSLFEFMLNSGIKEINMFIYRNK